MTKTRARTHAFARTISLRLLDVFGWATNVSGTWVPPPAPVRRYLRRARQHRRRLEAAYTPYPRRGVRPAPSAA